MTSFRFASRVLWSAPALIALGCGAAPDEKDRLFGPGTAGTGSVLEPPADAGTTPFDPGPDPGAGGSSAGGAPGAGGGPAGAGGAPAGGSAGTGFGGAGGDGFGGSAGSAGTGFGGSGATAGTSGAGTGGSAPTTPDLHLEFVDPTPGEIHVQMPGSPPMATVSFAVTSGSGIASVEYVIETGFSLGVSTMAPTFPLTYAYQYPGTRWAEAHGFDPLGAHVATARIDFVVQAPTTGPTDPPPTTGTCLGDLTALGVAYTNTTARGVVDAVKLNGPVNGVLFANGETTNPSGDPMACEFVKKLWAFADLLKEHGVVRIGTLGSYCYRCCCSWSSTNYCRGPSDPEPSCSSYSNHSWGRAVDVRYLWTASGQKWDINSNSDWTQSSSSTTCTSGIASQSGTSLTLYTIACQASARKIFGSVLTPNYNSAHRNHWHMDIGRSGTPSSFVTRSSLPNVDADEHGDE